MDQTGSVGAGSAIAVDADGRLHVGYFDNSNRDLKYATCAAACTALANWQSVAVDQPDDVGILPSLVLGELGRVHMVYADDLNGDLKYIE